MKSQVLNGVILSAKPFFEKDKRITVLTKESGKLTVLAKRAMSAKTKGMGVLEPLHYVKLNVTKGRQFYYLNSVEVNALYSNIRSSYDCLALALYFVDIILKSTMQGQQNDQLFQLLVSALSHLNESDDSFLEQIKTQFYMHFLTIEGIIPTYQNKVSDQEFGQLFGDYSGRLIQLPTFIGGS